MLRSVYEVVEAVLRVQDGPIRTPELAARVGLDPDHLNRVFRRFVGEPLGSFIRRLRLERAAYRLAHSRGRIGYLAEEAGFSGAESFCRAFARAYGTPPSQFRAEATAPWKIRAPSSMHWTPEGEMEVALREQDSLEVKIVRLRPIQLAAANYYAPYRDIWSAWERLGRYFPTETQARRLFCNFHEDGILKAGLPARAHLGFELAEGEDCPPGLEPATIPGGLFATIGPYAGAELHRRAWAHLNSNLVPKGYRKAYFLPGYDEYLGFPIPTDQMVCRTHLGLGLGPLDYA